MTPNSEDLRIQRTRKLLQKALLEVTAEKGFAHVTVRDIAGRAMVNRATFYRHYEDKYDLLAKYLEELSGMIGAGEAPPDPRLVHPADTPAPGLVNLLRHMQANADFYRVMLGQQGDPAFCAQSFRSYIEQGFRRMLPDEGARLDPACPPIELSVNYVLQAGMGAIAWWLEKGQAYTPEQMAVWLNQFSLATLSLSMKPASKKRIRL
jgi:AcrR family transcriptional regulator